MAFTTFNHKSYSKLGIGEDLKASAGISIPFSDYADGTHVGYFVQVKTSTKDPRGKIADLDATADPVIPGVLLRDSTTATENDGTLKFPFHPQVEVKAIGYVTVAVDPAVTPKFKDKVYAINTAGATIGMATNSATGTIDVGGFFDAKIDDGVWSVVLFGRA